MTVKGTKPDLVLCQVALSDYRAEFIEEMSRRLGGRFVVCSGDLHFERDVRVDQTSHLARRRVRNYFLFGRRLVFQLGTIGPTVRARHAVVEFNPRIINTWVALIARRLLRRPTILWGHAWSRKGRSSPTEWARRAQRTLATGILLYTEDDLRELATARPRRELFVAPNALYRADQLPAVSLSERYDIIYVGRLTASKRPDLLVEAFSRFVRLADVSDSTCTLHIVGDGPERASLQKQAAALGLQKRVRFHGHQVSPAALGPLYQRSFVSVSPGYVGLSLTQSALFGVPMLVADAERHAPEISLLIDGWNGAKFRAGDSDSLANELGSIWHARASWTERMPAIASWARSQYTVERMVDGFLQAALSSVVGRRGPSDKRSPHENRRQE